MSLAATIVEIIADQWDSLSYWLDGMFNNSIQQIEYTQGLADQVGLMEGTVAQVGADITLLLNSSRLTNTWIEFFIGWFIMWSICNAIKPFPTAKP